MKHILIPTDFSVRSLHIVHDIVKRNEGQKITVYILHLVHIPNDISDLIFFKKSLLYNRVPVAFTEAMQMLRNKYASQLKLELHFSYGNHVKALNMAIESFGIEEIYSSGKHNYTLPFTNSADIISMLPKCNIPVYKMGLKSAIETEDEVNMLSSLFSDDITFSKSKPESAF